MKTQLHIELETITLEKKNVYCNISTTNFDSRNTTKILYEGVPFPQNSEIKTDITRNQIIDSDNFAIG